MEVTALDGAAKKQTDFVITKFPNSLLLGINFTGDHYSIFLRARKKIGAFNRKNSCSVGRSRQK